MSVDEGRRAQCTLAVDALGGDYGSELVFEAVLEVLQEDADLRVILFSDKDDSALAGAASVGSLRLQYPLLSQHTIQDLGRFHSAGSLSLRRSNSAVSMTVKAAAAFHQSGDSSMADALRCAASAEADAVVSGGNTGALLLFAKRLIGTHSSIDRPAFIKRLQFGEHISYVLDLGANIDCPGDRLFQFAVMGSALVSALHRIESPRVALLNVGSEDSKGSEQVRLAARLAEESAWLNYVGFVEGDALFNSDAHVIVCDGFVGNIALKAGEEVARQVLAQLELEMDAHWYSSVLKILYAPALRRVRDRIDPDHNNGATLVGLNRTVIKSHGNAGRSGFASALRHAAAEARAKVAERVCSRLDSIPFNA